MPEHELKLSIDMVLGEQLRLRGRGIDTGLGGDTQRPAWPWRAGVANCHHVIKLTEFQRLSFK